MDKKVPDNILLAALKRNDPAAVELMWDRYAGDLLGFLKAVVCSRNDAEDLLQTVFVRIVQNRNRLAKARRLDAYVYKIARNEAFRFISRRKKNRTFDTAGEPWLVAAEDSRQADETAEQIQAALAQLPQQQREVIVMKIYRQKTFLEISGILGPSPNTVASRYRYGMEKLRRLLEDVIL